MLVPFRITEDDVWWERLGAWVDSAVWEDEDNEVLRLTYEAFPFAELEVERRPMQLLAREYLDSVAGGPIWGPLTNTSDLRPGGWRSKKTPNTRGPRTTESSGLGSWDPTGAQAMMPESPLRAGSDSARARTTAGLSQGA